MADLAIGGVFVLVLIVGIVEFSKKWGLAGNWLILETLVLAFVFGGLALAIGRGLIVDPALTWIELVVGALAFALGACGLYDLRKADIARSTDVVVIETELLADDADDADASEVASTADEALAAADEAYDRGFADAKKAAKKAPAKTGG